jgi:hypothetical protein
MEKDKIIAALGLQARELVKDPEIRDMLGRCTCERDRCELLAIASIYALIKAAQ